MSGVVVPLAARIVVAIIGGVLVIAAANSVISTIIVPRLSGGMLTRTVDWLVESVYELASSRIKSYKRADRMLATQAAATLLMQLLAWLLIFFVGFSLLFWPSQRHGITAAFTTAGPALWEVGSATASGAWQRAVLDVASLTGIVTVTLQIAYLPTLYSAFNRRETEVALLNARAGVPSWGPELLARTHYALGSGVSTVDTLPDLYAQWERFAADIAESHTTYLPLVRFRSPRPLSSWVTSLLCVLDSAALYLSLSPQAAPVVPARMCLRSGFTCLNDIARGMRLKVPEEPEGITLQYDDFLDAIARMEKVDFPIERKPEEAWLDFVGWRQNYEAAAYAIAYSIEAVPAMWSGPRRRPEAQIAPLRPPPGRAAKQPGAETGKPAAADQPNQTRAR